MCSLKTHNNFIQNENNNIIYLNDDAYFLNTDDSFNIYQICLLNDLQLPRFCYHNKLQIAGNCRICLVEIEKAVKLVISCSVIAESKILIFTDTKLVKDSQEIIFEYLLINHPLDCPICDQGGECDLQDQTILFGTDRGRFYEPFKRAVENNNYGPLIKVILNRCIHCARCTRFLWDIAGSDSLIFVNRGQNMQISSYILKFINNELSGNIIDLCPVGASTSKPYAYVSRLWEISDLYYVDIMDNNHSNINIQFRGLTILRIIPRINEFLNEDWITDKIRFFYDSLIYQRLIRPFFFYNFKKLYVNWLNCFYFLKFYFINFLHFYFVKKKKFTLILTFIGDLLNMEEILNLKIFLTKFNFNLFKTTSVYKNIMLDFRFSYLLSEKFNKMNNTNIYILINFNPRFESPLLNLKLKKIIIDNFILIIGFISNFIYVYKHLGTNNFNFLKFFENLYFSNKFILNKYNYFFIFGHVFFSYFSHLLNYFKNFNLILTNLVMYSVIHNNSSDVGLLELNLIKNFSKYNFNSTIIYLYNFFYNINNDQLKLNMKRSKYSFDLYQGSQGDYFIKYSKLIFPTKLFIEKSSIFINNEGLLQNLQHFFFKYTFKTIKYDTNIFYMLMDLCKITYICNDFNVNQNLITSLNQISPIFLITETSYYLTIWGKNSNFYSYFINFKFINIVLNSLINNFYLTNSISRNSKVLSICSKFFTVYNDFKYIYLINF